MSAAPPNFGPPGSGLPKCANSTERHQGAGVLRDWAVSELGKGIVLTTASPDTSGFQFVISDDQNWINAEDQNEHPNMSCYIDRGTDAFMQFNIAVLNP